MKISVITVCYNCEDTIGEALLSVNRQTHDNIEHIIVDGASRDATLEVVRTVGERVEKVISEPDGGIYDAMNKGLDVSSGDVVGFLNADDRYEYDGVLKDYEKAFEKFEVDACYGDLIYVRKDNWDDITRFWESRSYENGLCAKGWMPPHPTFYARTEIYEQLGYYDTRFHIQADFEMMYRLLDVHRIKTHYIPKVMVRMRAGGESNASIRNIIHGNREAIEACRKYGYRAGILFVARKLARKIPQYLKPMLTGID